MQQPDEKQRAASVPVGDDEALPLAWRRLLAAPRPAVVEDHGVLGFFVELMPEEGAAFARADVAPVLLTAAEHGRYSRPVPLDSRHLAHSPLQPHEQRLAASVLGLPQSVRKSRSYARLGGHVGDTLLAEILDTAPCFLGGLAGLRLSRGKSHQLNWHWQMEADGSQRLLPGATVELHLQPEGGPPHLVRGRVLRCCVARLHANIVSYRGAIAFDRDLPWFVEGRGERTTPQVI